MAKRSTFFGNEEYYHIYNRGVNKQPIFFNRSDYTHQLDSLYYYLFSKHRIKYSKFKELNSVAKKQYLLSIQKNPKLVEIIAYCFMPNHFHLILKQCINNGISDYTRIWQNSFAKYINIKHDRVGPLFQGNFKAVHIKDNDQLLHLSRYIHLNPLTSYIVKDEEALESYKWSSFGDYLLPVDNSNRSSGINPKIVISQFEKTGDYKKFVLDNTSYQRELDQIKHLIID